MKRLNVPWEKKDTKGKVSMPKPIQQDVSVQRTPTKGKGGKRAVQGEPSSSGRRSNNIRGAVMIDQRQWSLEPSR